MPNGQNEAFSRVLIDKALEFSGWKLLNPHEVRFELNSETGRAGFNSAFENKQWVRQAR